LAVLAQACGDDLALTRVAPQLADAGDAAAPDASDAATAVEPDADAPDFDGGHRLDAGEPLLDASTSDACATAEAGCPDPPLELAHTVQCGDIRLAVDDTHVYWTERDSGFVRAVPVTGGTVLNLAAEQVAPAHITTDTAGVYWVVRGSFEGETTWVRKLTLPLPLPLMASTPVNVATRWNSYGPIMSLVVHDNLLYYGFLHEVHQVTLGDEATLGDEPSDVTLARMYAGRGFPFGLIAEDTRVIWQDSCGALTSHDLQPVSSSDVHDMSGLVEITTVNNGLHDEFGYDATWYYWLQSNTVLRTRLDGTLDEPQLVLSYPADAMSSIALDDTHVYFASQDGRILKHTREPGAPETPAEYAVLATKQLAVRSLTVRDGQLYWATGDCAIRTTSVE
jgi:hypothetical protein